MSTSPRCQCNTKPAYPAAKDPTRCKRYRCPACKSWRPWCEGGTDDERCDTCVAVSLK